MKTNPPNTIKLTLALALSAALAFTGTTASAGVITTLNYPGANSTEVFAISGSQIVGRASFNGQGSTGYVYNGTTYTPLNAPGSGLNTGNTTDLEAISGSLILGKTNNGSQQQGWVYNTGTSAWTQIPSTVSGYQVADLSGTFNGNLAGDLWNGSQTLVPGQHVGGIYNVSASSWSTFSVPTAYSTWVTGAIGNTIVGIWADSSGNVHSYTYNGTTFTSYDVPGATDTYFNGVGPTSIVGSYVDSLGKIHGLEYDANGLTTYDVPGSIRTDLVATDGITMGGDYQDASGVTHGFVTSVPEPGTALFGMACVGVAALRRRRRA